MHWGPSTLLTYGDSLMGIKKFALWFLALLPSMAQPASPHMAKALVCRTGPGIHTEWEDQRPKSKTASNKVTFTISEIDLVARTARISGPGGSSVVRMIVTDAGLTLVEIVPNGSILFTTVYASSKANPMIFPLVDSRHVVLLDIDQPMASQYYGHCEGEF
jgi:hypothetical protein